MKRLICEMCGGTDLMKQDGVFVCQACGCKYSVEEARKMMVEGTVEVQGVVQISNTAQISNLMNMAKSAFDSKNYAKAEEFCNQIIAMDDKNYEAWKLKGEAISYQISTKNQRILEAYNCIMTSYRVLSDEDKEAKKHEIISSLKTCMEGEVVFWLEQFEKGRPTKATFARAKNAYFDAYKKMEAAFDEIGLTDEKEKYLISFDNFFIIECSSICSSAWKTTVGYNYYRDYFSTYGSTWIVNNFHNIDFRKDDYRPSKEILLTFMDETDLLIALEEFAATRVNYETYPKVIETIYSNIAFFHQRIKESHYFKLDWGSASAWDSSNRLGWRRAGLSESAVKIREQEISKCNMRKQTVINEIAAKKAEKEKEERKKRIEMYWEEHTEEKQKLDGEISKIKEKISKLNAQISDIENKNASKLNELNNERERKLPCEEQVDKQRDVIRDLENRKNECGLFKGKEKKAIQSRIDNEETPKLGELRKQAEIEKKKHQDKVDAEINVLKSEGKELRDEVALLQKQCDEINAELTKDR